MNPIYFMCLHSEDVRKFFRRFCGVTKDNVMKIIIISVRDDEIVYKKAERRIQELIKPKE